MDKKNIKITFAPDAFADFDGTQEELDEFVEKLKEMLTDAVLVESLEHYEELTVEAVEMNISDDEIELQNQSKRLH